MADTRPVIKKTVVSPVIQKTEGQELVGRLNTARTRLEELSKESSRLSGELGAVKKRCEEVESKCQTEFGCSTAELPGVIEQMRQTADATLAEVEISLGLREAPAPEAP